MNTKPAHSNLIYSIHHYLAFAEMIFLALLITGIFLKLSGTDSNTLFLISIIGVSAIYYIQAFKPPKRTSQDVKGPQGFQELLSQSIIPKVLYIALAISLTGILFAILSLEGGQIMQFIGGSSCVAGLLILVFFSVTGVKNLRSLFPLVLRVVIVLATNVFILIQPGILS